MIKLTSASTSRQAINCLREALFSYSGALGQSNSSLWREAKALPFRRERSLSAQLFRTEISSSGTSRKLTEILELVGKRTFLPLCLYVQPLISLATNC
jgi:hypothetical protein